MSEQRRRILESDKGETTITYNGVYIEGLNGKFYTTDTWASSKIANSIVVVSDSVRFRMALTVSPSEMGIAYVNNAPLENYMTAITGETAAKADYNGSGNTANILKMQPSTDYVAGYCNAFVFPNGKTKGFLPSLGQLYLAYKNKAAVNAALEACGGDKMSTGYNLSSTFKGIEDDTYKFRCLWTLRWYNGEISITYSNNMFKIRPFAAC